MDIKPVRQGEELQMQIEGERYPVIESDPVGRLGVDSATSHRSLCDGGITIVLG